MGSLPAIGVFLLLLSVGAAAAEEEGPIVIKQDITIRARGGVGPPVRLPPPTASPQVLDEVIDSLEIYRGFHKDGVRPIKLLSTRRRLEAPFPRAPFLVFASKSDIDYDRWVFAVFSGREELWRISGDGRLREYLDWDGSGPTGDVVVRVGGRYHFEFSGWKGSEQYSVASEALKITSLSYKELLGGIRLEVSNRILFGKGGGFSKGARRYLRALGDRMRNVRLDEEPYKLILHQRDPGSRTARARVKTLRRFLSKYLMIAGSRIRVDIRSLGKRGDVTACILPTEMGETFKVE